MKTSPAAPLTDNGIHLTAYGYWRAGVALQRGLGFPPLRSRSEIELDGKRRRYEFKLTRETLPPPAPANVPAGASPPGDSFVLRLRGLASGIYQLKIDGQLVAAVTAEARASGVSLVRGPDVDQVERLRQRIIDKNRHYFYRWRPQNETYLFGFRKHEQGQNAREIPQFDPLVAKQEEEIANLRIRVEHHYELILTNEKER